MGAEVFGMDLGVTLPNFSTAGVGFWIAIVLAFVMFLAIGAILIWNFVIQPKIYNKKIILFENIGGQGYQQTGKDTARVIKVGDSGEELLFLRKRKVYRTAYGRKMGNNVYWFAVGQDGYWYNILLGDLDAKMGMLDIEPIDRDMRYMHVAIRKNIQERYRKIGVMEKYGPIIISGLFLIIMVVAVWLLIAKQGDAVREITKAIEAIKPLADTLNNVAGKLDSICSGGSGITPAG